MCTITAAAPTALVCDVALPVVRSALAAEPELSVSYESEPGEGTQVRLVRGDLVKFEERLRAAAAEASR